MTLQYACTRFAEVADFSNRCSSCGPLDVPVAEDYLDAASDVLYQLSGGSYFGECQRTLRPVRRCTCGFYGSAAGWTGDSMLGLGLGPMTSTLCSYCLSCGEVDQIPLRTPVISVDEVKIDGVPLAPSDYTFTTRGMLYRVATDVRPPRWPSCQDLWRPDTEPNTFSITYTFGQPAPYPAWVVNACVEIACEFAAPPGRSKLPASTTAATMQNVTLSLQTRAEAIKEAKTYLPAVAQFLAIVNPAGIQSWIYSPQQSSAWAFPLT